MDRDTHDLIAQLCTRAGMIMEDASPMALSIGSTPTDEWVAQIDELIGEMERAASLLGTARVLFSD